MIYLKISSSANQKLFAMIEEEVPSFFFATQRLANTRLYFLESITFNVLQLNWSSRHPGMCVRVCARVNVCAYRSFKFQRIVENFVSAFKSNKEIVVF